MARSFLAWICASVDIIPESVVVRWPVSPDARRRGYCVLRSGLKKAPEVTTWRPCDYRLLQRPLLMHMNVDQGARSVIYGGRWTRGFHVAAFENAK